MCAAARVVSMPEAAAPFLARCRRRQRVGGRFRNYVRARVRLSRPLRVGGRPVDVAVDPVDLLGTAAAVVVMGLAAKPLHGLIA